MWSAASRAEKHRDFSVGEKRMVWYVLFSPDSRMLAAVYGRGGPCAVKVWNVKTRKELVVISGVPYSAYHAVRFSPDSRFLGCATTDGAVILWDAKAGTKRVIGKHDARCVTMNLSDDGKLLVSGDAEGGVKVWRMPAGQ